MKKQVLTLMLAVALLAAAGCNGTAPDQSAKTSKNSASTSSVTQSELATIAAISSDTDASGQSSTEESKDVPVKNLYPGLDIQAELLKKQVAPGEVLPIKITVKNIGDKTIAYSQGSGSYTTPDSLQLEIPGLQAVAPRDYLGIATADLVTLELKPGESITYTLNVMAVKPSEEFAAHELDLMTQSNVYIADRDWATNKTEFPDLVAATDGTYDGSARLLYYVVDPADENPSLIPTGYAEATFTIVVAS